MSNPLQGERLAAVPAGRYGNLKFRFHPATRLTASDYPVHLIWQSNQEGYSGDPVVDLDQGGAALLVGREAYQVVLQALTQVESVFLTSVLTGKDFS